MVEIGIVSVCMHILNNNEHCRNMPHNQVLCVHKLSLGMWLGHKWTGPLSLSPWRTIQGISLDTLR